MELPTNVRTLLGFARKTRDIVSVSWVFKARREDKGFAAVDFFFAEKSTVTGTYYMETVLPKAVQEMENP